MNDAATTGEQVTPKQQLRERLKALRQGLWHSPLQREMAAARLQTELHTLVLQQRWTRVLVYLSSPDEASTDAFITRNAGALELLVPLITGPGLMDAVRFPGWEALVQGPFGIRRPRAPEIYTGAIEAVVVPGLGFTADGGRLGYGKGFYDRWLAGHPDACRIGLAYAAQVLPMLPIEAHDERLDILVTEEGVKHTHARQRNEPGKTHDS